MSRDIRSFFNVQSSKKVSQESSKKNDKESSVSKSKKKRAVIESDSDDDIFEVKPVTKATTSPDKKKQKVEPARVNAVDVFGTDSVKRTARKSNGEQTSEFHDDPDFDQVLQELDESQWEEGDVSSNKNKQISSQKSSASSSKSPVKELGPSLNPNKRSSSSSSSSSSTKVLKGTSPESPSKSNEVEVCDPPKVNSLQTTQSNTKRLKLEKLDRVSTTSQSKEKGKSQIEEVSKLGPKKTSPVKVIKKEDNIQKQPRFETPKKETRPVIEPSPPSYMWVDKYKPTSLKQIIGQQGDKSNVKKLLSWLSSWHSNHGPGANKKLVRPSPWAKDDSGAFFKAALLSGPPGVGKTTTAHLVCKELGMDVVEFNASDTRSKKLLSDEVGQLLSTKSLLPFFQSGGESKTTSKHVLVMDEVDGMAGNEDRGGVAELINLIKNSKCPVICMCNDRNHAKIRSLAGYCFDLRFYKPRVEQIRGALMSVCFKEKVQISPQALDEVIAGTNCDIRQVLNNLSMWSSTQKKLNTEQVKEDANAAKKIIKLGPWDAVRKVFSSEDHKTMSLMDKSDLFFHDYGIMPLFVQEAYLTASPRAAKNKTDVLHHLARAATSISYGDLIEKTIRSSNSWSLLPVQSIFSSVVPGEWMEGHLTGQIQFPSWLGKNSRGNKMSRLLQDLQVHMRLSISGGKQAVNLDYLEPIMNSIIRPLTADGAQGVPKTLEAMQNYYVTRDDLDSLLELCKWPGRQDPMAAVESKVKAALTRAYNKGGGFMTPYALDAPIKKKRGGAHDDIGEGGDGEAEAEGSDDDDESDDDAGDAMIKAKKTDKKDSSGPSSSKTTTSSRGSRGGSRGTGAARGRGRGRGKK